MFCGKCGTKLEDGSKFCGKCGAPQMILGEGNSAASVPIATIPQPDNLSAPAEPKKYEFAQEKYLLGLPLRGTNYKTIHTTIEIENGIINVQHWNGGVFVDNTVNHFSINPKDISDIQVEKPWDWGAVAYVVLCVVVGLLGGAWYVWLFALLGLLVLKRKEIALYYMEGKLLIPDSSSDTKEVHDLVANLQMMNSMIRVYGLDNQ